MRRHIGVRLEIGSCRAVSLPALSAAAAKDFVEDFVDLLLSLSDNLRRYGKLGMA